MHVFSSGHQVRGYAMPQNYIGVYATKEKAPSIGDYPRPLGLRKRLWFVWESAEGKYTVQPLNAAQQPMAEPRVIPGKEFSDRYTYEADCFLAPAGATHPSLQGVAAEAMALPDLFQSSLGGSGQDSPLPPPAAPAGVRADDPDLLLAWARSGPTVRADMADPVQIPFDRLVGEVVETPEPLREGDPSASADAAEPAGEETQLARQLRSQFVQALLLIRRGAKSESLALLEEMLTQTYEPFAGGAQLFSEFGLGLRRLGFVQHALAAHRKALEFSPDDARILFNIARTYHDLDLLPEARDYLEQALAVDPDFVTARQFLMFLDISQDGTGKDQ